MKTDETLVILTPGFAASEKDSNCLPMQQSLVRTFEEVYPNLKIVILSFQYPYFIKTYDWHNATVYSFGGRNKGGIRKLLLRQKIYKTLLQIHRSKTIVGLLSFWYGECAVVGKKFGAEYKIKHRCWLLGQDARQGNQHPRRNPLKENELIALSDFIQAEFERNYDIKPVHIISPGINPHHIPLHEGTKDIDLLAAGSLIPLKQYQVFIKVIAKIKKLIPSIKAVLIGDGSERALLQNLVDEHSLKENVCLKGELPHEEVLKMIQRAKVFLHPSSYEGFGVVCLEALYAGAEVISFVQPMNQKTTNWHIAKSEEEMVKMALAILEKPASEFKSKIVFDMHDTARQIASLYSIKA